MKKNRIFSLILALTLVLSMGAGAFATPVNGGPLDNVTFKKSVTTKGDGALNPTETFNFTITPKSAKNEQGNDIEQPEINSNAFSITVDEGTGEQTLDVALPEFLSVGTYEYNVQEAASTTAGMVYDTTLYTFTVVVLNSEDGTVLEKFILADEDGKKVDEFENEYEAGSLVVNKKITGNNANFEETFPVRVTLTGADSKLIKSTITVAGNEGTVAQTGNGTNEVVITFDVTNNSNVKINNIPAGVTYKVEETDLKNYTPTYTNENATIVVNKTSTTDIVNDLSKEINTGISFDNLPYILLLAGAAIGLGALIVRKRKNNEY